MPKFIQLKNTEQTNINCFIKEGRKFVPIDSGILGFQAGNFNIKIYKLARNKKSNKSKQFLLKNIKLGYISKYRINNKWSWTKDKSKSHIWPSHRSGITMTSAEIFAGKNKLVREKI